LDIILLNVRLSATCLRGGRGWSKLFLKLIFFAKKSVSKTACSEGFQTFDTPFKINES
jgi:hypothetical protein